jgi:hypothetical protein
MADSANILSILSMLGSQGQTPPPGADAPDVQLPGVAQQNVMQAAAPAPSPSPPIDPAAVASAAAADSPPAPKPKRSLLDTIGKISDVLATVGGAAPLYEPSINARTDRVNALADRDRRIAADNIALATSKFDLSNKQGTDERSRFANVLDAINDPEDAARLPDYMQAAGLTDPRYAPFVAMVQKDPQQAKILASALGAGSDDKLGHNLYFGTDQNGKTVAYQIGDDGNPHILDLSGKGITPGEPVKVVNTGGSNVVVGGQTGQVKKILPNSVSPNTAANNAQSNTNNVRTTTTQLTIAGMPARSKDGAGTKANAGATAQDALTALDNIQGGFDRLHSMQALPGEGGALNQVESALGRTGIGQKVGAQFNTPAAQERLAMQKNLKNLQSYMIQSLPGSATRTKFEQEIQNMRLPDPMQMNYATATRVIGELRASYKRALAASAQETKNQPAATGGGNLPTLTPEQAARLPSGARFRTTDGRVLVRH